MEAISGLGLFWLPTMEPLGVTGELKFDQQDGITLTILGSFNDDLYRDPGPEDRILGYVDGKRLTLELCEPSKHVLRVPGTRRQEYRVAHMFVGHHFGAGENVEFENAYVWFDVLPFWVKVSPIVVRDIEDDHGRQLGRRIEHNRIEPETIEYDGASVGLAFDDSSRPTRTGFIVTAEPYISITRQTAVPWVELWEDVGHLQDLVSICADVPAGIRKICFSQQGIPERAMNGRSLGFPRLIEFKTDLVFKPRPLDSPSLRTRPPLLTFEQAGGLQMVARWLAISGRFSQVLGSAMSTRYRSGQYVENRFLNTISAAEALHRLTIGGNRIRSEQFNERVGRALGAMRSEEEREWLNQILRYANEPTLRKRLLELFREVRPAMSGLIANSHSWAKAVADVRNRLTHLEQMSDLKFDGESLHWLTESVFDLTRVSLLKESGLPDAELEKLGSSWSRNSYRDRLIGAIRNTSEVFSQYDQGRQPS